MDAGIKNINTIALDQFTLTSNAVLLSLFLLQASVIYALLAYHDLLDHFIPSLYGGILYAGLALTLAAHYVKKPENAYNINTLISIIVPGICIPIFISLFSSMKSTMPMISPFYLDEFLMKADQFLHFGLHPWQISHAFFGGPGFTVFLDLSYNLWFVVMYGFTIFLILNVKRKILRMQYLLAFVMIWSFLGLFSAGFLASAGPVYYADIVREGIYNPLMSELKSLNGSLYELHALGLQDRLWNDYLTGTTKIGSGISAMPSMHVAQAMLMFLSSRHINRWLSRFMFGFLIIIMIGSVHLGWHYALDGYVSVIAVWIIWQFCAILVNILKEKIKGS